MGARVHLDTARLLLRPVRESDAVDLHTVYGNSDVMRYWSSLPDPDLDTTLIRTREMAAVTSPTYLVIERDGAAIGAAGVHTACELGFILGKDHWRQGYMTEALNALIPWLFETCEFPCLTADVDPRNTASIATLKAVGFVETGRAARTFCVDGEWSDSIYFELRP